MAVAEHFCVTLSLSPLPYLCADVLTRRHHANGLDMPNLKK